MSEEAYQKEVDKAAVRLMCLQFNSVNAENTIKWYYTNKIERQLQDLIVIDACRKIIEIEKA